MKQQSHSMTHADCLKAIQVYSKKITALSQDLDPQITAQIMLELEQLLNYAQNNHEPFTLELGLNFHRVK
ncbi:MAG: hypothetical protein AAF846_24835 [Chloroflexota bacterium]